MLYMVFWVALYGLTHTVSQLVSRHLAHGAQWLTPLAMVLYVSALLLWLIRTGKARQIALRFVRLQGPVQWLYALPLLLLPLYNIVTAKGFRFQPAMAVLTLCVCLVEEVFFRGFLLHAMAKHNARLAAYLSGAVFALFHLVNLTQGSEASYVLVQVCCAFAVGICYGAITLTLGSLLPCVFAHVLTNLTAVSPENTGGLWACVVIYIGYGIWLIHKDKRIDKETSL